VITDIKQPKRGCFQNIAADGAILFRLAVALLIGAENQNYVQLVEKQGNHNYRNQNL